MLVFVSLTTEGEEVGGQIYYDSFWSWLENELICPKVGCDIQREERVISQTTT